MDAPSAHVRHRGPPREPPPDVKANVKPRRERKSSLDAAFEDALEFVDTNFNIIVYTLTWIACIAGLLWSMLMSYVIVARPTEPTPTVLILAKYVRWTAAVGIALLLVPFLSDFCFELYGKHRRKELQRRAYQDAFYHSINVNSYRVHGIWQRIAFWSSAKPAGLDRSRSLA